MRKLVWILLSAIVPTPLLAKQYFVTVGGTTSIFSPQFLTIAVGDTVIWTNIAGTHNVQADDGSFFCSIGCKGDGKGDTGAPARAPWSVSHTFTQPGVVGYFCELHGMPGSGMWGSVTVGTSPVRLLSFDVE